MAEKNCRACAFSYMGPGDLELVCGHDAAGVFGVYARLAVEATVRAGGVGHCGPQRPKFKQHPLRNPDGSLKCGDCEACQDEKTPCACDGAYDDGCFQCHPEKHERPACPR